MEKLAITFEHRGRMITGYFIKVAGAGDQSTWHLHDQNHYFLGRLRSPGKWVFDENKGSVGMSERADYFGDFITAWYQ